MSVDNLFFVSFFIFNWNWYAIHEVDLGILLLLKFVQFMFFEVLVKALPCGLQEQGFFGL